MPNANTIQDWVNRIRQRYENYLKTSFFFKKPELRDSFQKALREEGSLMKGPFPEQARNFEQGVTAQALARECFLDKSDGLLPALIGGKLYTHQERAIRAVHLDNLNIVVATGTASGKTESFLYPILFELHQQYLTGELEKPGVRAMILYPMNALANDQRVRLGEICKKLKEAGHGFSPTFGQYIGQTPNNARDYHRNAAMRCEERLPGELIFRDEMREKPPHILLTNYSMLEYLLIRPNDSPLFDSGMGKHWQFIVLDEAHQYRGAKGMEMGMLIRRLKQRLQDGGRQEPFRCIATSATISSGEGEEDKKVVAKFAKALFGENFSPNGIIFSSKQKVDDNQKPQRYHAFLRALEGAFLVHKKGEDVVVLNRKGESENGLDAAPLEIALCRECGQHYYVGREHGKKLTEAIRDPSDSHFGVDYYLPLNDNEDTADGHKLLCKSCSLLSKSKLECSCNATISVKKCKSHKEHTDQLEKCEACGYKRGGVGDPVQEIVHGTDGPNAVIATAMHELLPENKRKVLAFADSRQEAAFFAWYAEDSYEKLRDRNFILRAMKASPVDEEGLSIDDLKSRLLRQCEQADLFVKVESKEQKNRQVLTSILREALTDERRLSLSGVGLVKWFVKIPDDLIMPEIMLQPPWSFTREEALCLIGYLLDELRLHRAMNLPENAATPVWSDVSSWPQHAYGIGKPGGRRHVSEWGNPQSAVVKHFLRRILESSDLPDDQCKIKSTKLMEAIWDAWKEVKNPPILSARERNGTFRLNPSWLRIKSAKFEEIWECNACANLSAHNIRDICPRNGCAGCLIRSKEEHFRENHYRTIYESKSLPPAFKAKEHTAQIDTEEARQRQQDFKDGNIHLLSSSTTFEVGVDLGDLEVVFLRNVPPEAFSYVQRVGRAGRRDTPGLAVTYCRRNPHDLYHYENPEERVIRGVIQPPRLFMTNKKIILRHMVATVLSSFFRENEERFKTVKSFIENWKEPCMVADVRQYCEGKRDLKGYLLKIVPEGMHGETGLEDGTWIKRIIGDDSHFAASEAEVCADYNEMEKLKEKEAGNDKYDLASRLKKRMSTIAEEKALNFLSRKAIIPKYGFPVDVVELDTRSLDTRSTDKNSRGVILQRDLSQAIAEYAPGGKVVANKLEWESYGIKMVHGKELRIQYYQYDDARNFTQWNEGDADVSGKAKKYLIPEFGFVTPMFNKPKEPTRRAQRLYTTRPFFLKHKEDNKLKTKKIFGVQVTTPQPGKLVILCEGKNKSGFQVCCSCGSHMASEPKGGKHQSPTGSECKGTLKHFSLGHEMDTDVVRLQFHQLCEEWRAYSVAYAVLLGAAETLNVPANDLNVTITGSSNPNRPDETAIVLYDNVPGGAGLVAQLVEKEVFSKMIYNAISRVSGNCGCDSSCYGCLRNYRNQFAHPYLDRKLALDVLKGT